MTISRNPKVFSKKIRGKWVILESNKKNTQILNNSASFIWGLLEKPLSQEQICSSLRQEYSIDETTAQKDAADFISDYLKKGFLISTTFPR